jgi:hypothetical protein
MGVLGTLEGRREAQHHNAVLSVIVSAYSLLFSEGLLWPSPSYVLQEYLKYGKGQRCSCLSALSLSLVQAKYRVERIYLRLSQDQTPKSKRNGGSTRKLTPPQQF